MTPRIPPIRALVLSLALCLAATAHAAVTIRPDQPSASPRVPEPRQVEVALTGSVTTTALLRAGLDLVGMSEGTATLLEWPGDAERLAPIGANGRVLDEHPGRTAALAAAAELGSAPAPPLRMPPQRAPR